MKRSIILFASLVVATCSFAQKSTSAKPRARDLGIPFDGKPGANNAITDVKGVLVGYKTIIKDSAKTATGSGPVRTGVTVIFPNGKSNDPVPAAWFSLNGDGEMTGLASIEDYGFNFGPIGITNTNSVGVVRDAIGEWNIKHFGTGELIDFSFGLPVVAETWDGLLNDIQGLHVKKEDVFEALDNARSGAVAEGNIGGGTGMGLYGFKGGNGTASRVIKIDTANYTVGVFMQANFGGRNDLLIAGIPVGREIKGSQAELGAPKRKDGSVIIMIATDAPLLPSQLKQVAKRAAMGIARTGSFAHNSSGDIFLAFSTQAPARNEKGTAEKWNVLTKEAMDRVYKATVEATEEAVINALIAAETMKGKGGNTLYGIPHDQVKEILKKYNRLVQ
ncbi:P1 family peptidase [Paraflavitalea sp. CAU 1676]|uniref:DmpA family aminopeptidase n=1 Tax=Paraflavitalea sp. CAU 1676 TaxID=3032598 RepID=UPI0023DAED70|nr:P1 family peptidase [Paraflavitalea sp. CAU 1676]MDF2190683.1 P1 family peptidase [Paraflavitalea sp. CAU 1676]